MEQAIIGIDFDNKSSQIHWTYPHHKVKINTEGKYAVQSAISSRDLKGENIYASEYYCNFIDEIINSTEAINKKVADKIVEEQEKVKLDELVEITRWVRVDGEEGSLLKTFPKQTKIEMLNTLKLVKSGIPHKYKKHYSINIDNKIAVLEYLLKDYTVGV